MVILDKPSASVPKRRAIPNPENDLTVEVRELNKKYFNQISKFREDAEKLRKGVGVKG